jgi:lysophospholipase L1-like esterase
MMYVLEVLTRGLVPSSPSAYYKRPKGLTKSGVLKAGLLAVVASLFGLLLAELGWRTYLHATGRGFFDDPREFTSPFFTSFKEPMPYFDRGRLVYHNGWVPQEKAAHEIRVICFGGSTTVNWRAGVSYPELLEARLAGKANGFQVRVLNAGADGHSTAHFLVNLSLRNLDAQPDIVTVYENINDLSASWFADEPVLPDYAQKYKAGYYLGLRHRLGVLPAIARISRLARFLFSRMYAIEFPIAPENDRADYRRGLGLFRRNLRNIVAVAKRQGIRVLLASQPSRSDWREAPGAVAFNRAVAEVADEEGVAFADVARAVTDDSLFLDRVHNNRAGVKAVAEAFYEPLLAEVKAVAIARSGHAAGPDIAAP